MPVSEATREAIRAARLAYPPAEAAQLLGLSRATLYKLIADGTIPSVKIIGSRRIRHEAIVDYLDRLQLEAS